MYSNISESHRVESLDARITILIPVPVCLFPNNGLFEMLHLVM